MAKGKAKKAAKPAAKGKKTGKRGPANGMLILLTCAALVPFSLPTIVILFVGLLPSLVAVVAERGRNRYAWMCVGGLNFAGLAPWLFKLWFGHHTLVYALEQISGIKMLLTAYAGAGCGWLLYLAVPPLVQTFLSATTNKRVDALKAVQKRLVEQWGEGVSIQSTNDSAEETSGLDPRHL